MGYYFYDVDGYLDEGPSIRGLEELRESISGPAINELLKLGSTERLDELQQELDVEVALSVEMSDPPSVQADIKALRRTVVRSAGILILTDGVGMEEE